LLKEIAIAIHAYFKAYTFVWKKQTKSVWILGVCYAMLFTLGFYLFFTSSTHISNLLLEKTNIKNWLQSNHSLLNFFFIVALVMFNLVLLIYYFGIFKYLYLFLLAPVCSYVSIQTSNRLYPTHLPINVKAIVRLSKHSMLVVLKNFFWQTLYTLLFLLLTLIPLVGWVIPIIALLLEFYYLGYSHLDYTLQQKKDRGSTIPAYIARHKGMAIGNGMLFYALHIIPLLGWILAPNYAMVAAPLSIKELEQ
jgi:CysZ protein